MAKRKAPMEIAPFDACEHLDNEEVIAEYLAAALEDPIPNVFLCAVADVAKAQSALNQRWRTPSSDCAADRNVPNASAKVGRSSPYSRSTAKRS